MGFIFDNSSQSWVFYPPPLSFTFINMVSISMIIYQSLYNNKDFHITQTLSDDNALHFVSGLHVLLESWRLPSQPFDPLGRRSRVIHTDYFSFHRIREVLHLLLQIPCQIIAYKQFVYHSLPKYYHTWYWPRCTWQFVRSQNPLLPLMCH